MIHFVVGPRGIVPHMLYGTEGGPHLGAHAEFLAEFSGYAGHEPCSRVHLPTRQERMGGTAEMGEQNIPRVCNDRACEDVDFWFPIPPAESRHRTPAVS